jgi:hypothetical protein
VAARIGTLLELDWPRLCIETEADIDALISAVEPHQDAETDDSGQLEFVSEWVAEVYEMLLPLSKSDSPTLTKTQMQRLDAIRVEFDRACSLIGFMAVEQRKGFSERLEKTAPQAEKMELGLGEKNTEIQVLRQEIIDLNSEREKFSDILARETLRAETAEESLKYRFAELSDLGEKYTQFRLLRFYAALDSGFRLFRRIRFRIISFLRSRSRTILKRLGR